MAHRTFGRLLHRRGIAALGQKTGWSLNPFLGRILNHNLKNGNNRHSAVHRFVRSPILFLHSELPHGGIQAGARGLMPNRGSESLTRSSTLAVLFLVKVFTFITLP